MISYVVVMFARTARLWSESQSRDASSMVDVYTVLAVANASEARLKDWQISRNLPIPSSPKNVLVALGSRMLTFAVSVQISVAMAVVSAAREMRKNLPRIIRKPLSLEVASICLSRVANEEYPPGTNFPPEGELAQEFGVSRVVIREAIRTLSAKGLVTVRQGRNTVVNPVDHWNQLDPQILLSRIEAGKGRLPGPGPCGNTEGVGSASRRAGSSPRD